MQAVKSNSSPTIDVAPARERGLKFMGLKGLEIEICGRSREGAWIEISCFAQLQNKIIGRSREGAWIEI